MKNSNLKVNIRDNLNSNFKDKDNYIEVKLSKNNIDGKILLEMFKHGLSKILPFMESKSSFFKKTTKITPNLGVNSVNYFKFPLYESLLKNKKTIDKELKKIMPSILQDISKTLDSYEWNVDVEYRRGFRGDNLLYFLNTMNGESNDDYYQA